MNIKFLGEWDGDASSMGSKIRDVGYRMFYGGMTYTTTCCVNRHNYRPGIDTPCNSAAARSPFLFGVVGAAVGLWLWR